MYILSKVYILNFQIAPSYNLSVFLTLVGKQSLCSNFPVGGGGGGEGRGEAGGGGVPASSCRPVYRVSCFFYIYYALKSVRTFCDIAKSGACISDLYFFHANLDSTTHCGSGSRIQDPDLGKEKNVKGVINEKETP